MQSKIFVSITIGVLLVTSGWTQWHRQIVDNAGNAGKHAKIINDNTNNPHIFYVTDDNYIMHARWTGSGWNIERIASFYKIKGFDAVLGSNGRWHLCSSDSSYPLTGRLRYVYNLGTLWRDTVIETMDYTYYLYPAIALDTLNAPHIVDYNTRRGELEHWWYVPEYPAHWERERIESAINISWISMVIDTHNNIYVAFCCDGDLKLAVYDGTQWSSQIVDLPGNVGNYCDLKLDSNGRPCISYYDATNGDLRYAVGTPIFTNKNTEPANQNKEQK